MKVSFGLLSACANVRDKTGRDYLEDEDLGQIFRQIFVCSFPIFKESRDNDDDVTIGTNSVVEWIATFTSQNIEAVIDNFIDDER